MDTEIAEPEAILRLVRELGAAAGTQTPTPGELTRLREFFGHRVLRSEADSYITRKLDEHALEWPPDTDSNEYLECLRATVLDRRSAIYLTDDEEEGHWAIYFVGPVRRVWRGPRAADRIVVIFSAERHLFVTGFQAGDRRAGTGEAYVERQGGFWVYRS